MENKPNIAFTVFGTPVAQGRPRAGKTPKGKVVMYDPDNSRDYKQYVALVASQHRPNDLIVKPVSLTVIIYKPIPQSWSKKRQQRAAEGLERPTSKPDLSNYIKGVEDAIEGIILKNDSQVVDYGKSGKWYSWEPRIEVSLKELR